VNADIADCIRDTTLLCSSPLRKIALILCFKFTSSSCVYCHH